MITSSVSNSNVEQCPPSLSSAAILCHSSAIPLRTVNAFSPHSTRRDPSRLSSCYSRNGRASSPLPISCICPLRLTHPSPIRILIVVISSIMAKAGILQSMEELRPLDLNARFSFSNLFGNLTSPAFGLAHTMMPCTTLIAAMHKLGATCRVRGIGV